MMITMIQFGEIKQCAALQAYRQQRNSNNHDHPYFLSVRVVAARVDVAQS